MPESTGKDDVQHSTDLVSYFPHAQTTRKQQDQKYLINFFLGGADSKTGCLDLWPVPVGILQYSEILCTPRTFMRGV